MNLVTDS